jgi:hypothetical protein
MLRKSGIMINLKKIPAAVYEDNTFQLFLIYGGGRESLDKHNTKLQRMELLAVF